jgi:hypothetical protein
LGTRGEAELERLGLGEPELLELAHREGDEVVVGHLPELVAGEAEVLHADAGLGRVGDHPWAPGAEVLDPADLDVGLVDVDPVVGKEVLAVEDE